MQILWVNSQGLFNVTPALIEIVAWWQAIIWFNDGPVYCRIYASLGLYEVILAIIGSDNGLSPGRHQAIIGTNVGI